VSYGVDDKADVLFAEKLAPVVPGARLIPVPNAGHNCFYELARRGELTKLVSDFLAPTPVVF
jgi:pimeloyl-ACP methyl ester carboxylesterase